MDYTMQECFERALHGEPVVLPQKLVAQYVSPASANLVLIPQAVYEDLLKAQRNLAYNEMIDEGLEQLVSGATGVVKTMEELCSMASEKGQSAVQDELDTHGELDESVVLAQ